MPNRIPPNATLARSLTVFEVLDACGRTVRSGGDRDPANNRRPFGGIQLVCCGDFFQLPPVGLGSYGKKFAFQSGAWTACDTRAVVLRKVVRQQGDQTFVRLLNECVNLLACVLYSLSYTQRLNKR